MAEIGLAVAAVKLIVSAYRGIKSSRKVTRNLSNSDKRSEVDQFFRTQTALFRQESRCILEGIVGADAAIVMMAQPGDPRWCGMNLNDIIDENLHSALLLATGTLSKIECHLQKAGRLTSEEWVSLADLCEVNSSRRKRPLPGSGKRAQFRWASSGKQKTQVLLETLRSQILDIKALRKGLEKSASVEIDLRVTAGPSAIPSGLEQNSPDQLGSPDPDELVDRSRVSSSFTCDTYDHKGVSRGTQTPTGAFENIDGTTESLIKTILAFAERPIKTSEPLFLGSLRESASQRSSLYDKAPSSKEFHKRNLSQFLTREEIGDRLPQGERVRIGLIIAIAFLHHGFSTTSGFPGKWSTDDIFFFGYYRGPRTMDPYFFAKTSSPHNSPPCAMERSDRFFSLAVVLTELSMGSAITKVSGVKGITNLARQGWGYHKLRGMIKTGNLVQEVGARYARAVQSCIHCGSKLLAGDAPVDELQELYSVNVVGRILEVVRMFGEE